MRLKTVCKFIIPVLLLILWQVVSTQILDPTKKVLLPPPSGVVTALSDLCSSELYGIPEILVHIKASLIRFFLGFLIAIVIGIPLGISLGLSRTLENFVYPIVNVFRSVSPIAWIPLSLAIFGIGNTTCTFIVFYGAFFPIVINTRFGIKSVDRNLIRAGLVLGVRSKLTMLKEIIFPSALPNIFTGLRIGLGVGWQFIIAAELIGATTGLGFFIMNSRFRLFTEGVILGMLSIGIIGSLINLGTERLRDEIIKYEK